MNFRSNAFFLSLSVKKFKNRFAIITPTLQMTYSELHAAVIECRYTLLSRGVKPEDKIALTAYNLADNIIFLLSIISMNATAVLLSTRWSERQISAAMQNVNCSKILTSGLPKRVLPGMKYYQVDAFARTDNLSDFLAIKFNPHLPATALFTSGSSGQPKAVVHSLMNHLYSAIGSNKNILLVPDDRWLLSLPLYHAAGLGILFRTLLSGAAIVIGNQERNFSENIADFRITHLSFVAAQLYRFLSENEISSQTPLKAILLGGSSIPHNLLEKSHSLGLPIFTSYGSSEMASQIATTAPQDSLAKLQTSGRLLPHRQLKIAPDGEILVKGETLCLGYLKEGQIISITDSDGWFHTGDIGYLDAENYLSVSGRKDNMFISGGENIHPEEIEKLLLQHPRIKDAVVVAVENTEFGQRPAAFIKSSSGLIKDSELVEHLTGKIEKFKIPEYFFTWPEKIQNGFKINRAFFRQEAQARIRARH